MTASMLRRTLPLLLVPTLLVAGCGGDDGGSDTTTTSTDSTTTTAPYEAPEPDPEADEAALAAVQVTEGEEGEEPTLEFEKPFAVTTTLTRALVEGEGAAIVDGNMATFDFLFLNGRDGTPLATSYGMEPAAVTVSDDLLAGLKTGLTGLTVGTQALIAITPTDAFADLGDDPQTGVLASDSLLMYVDIHDTRSIPTRAEGTPVEPVEGLPTVTLDDDGAPTITIPDAEPPAELVTQLLIEGAGPAVETGQTITVQYAGVTWSTGEAFDSSWATAPASFPIGTGGVIAGWDKGLVGQKVGSQVLLVVPPEDGYPEGRGEEIPPGSTLVFVVDILDAR